MEASQRCEGQPGLCHELDVVRYGHWSIGPSHLCVGASINPHIGPRGVGSIEAGYRAIAPRTSRPSAEGFHTAVAEGMIGLAVWRGAAVGGKFGVNAAQWIRTKAIRAGRAPKHPEFDQEPDSDDDQYDETNQAKRVDIPIQGNVEVADWEF